MGIKMPVYDTCDFSKLDDISVVCRGKSLGAIEKYKDNFKHNLVVGQYLQSFKRLGKHFEGSKIVRIHGSTFSHSEKKYHIVDDKYGIIDIQTYLDVTKSDRKAYKHKKIGKRMPWLKCSSRPINFLERNDRFRAKRSLGDNKRTHPTLGTYAVDLAAAFKPKNIHIIGLDFYSVPDFTPEKMRISHRRNAPKMKGMIQYLRLLCMYERDINFHLYTCCKEIKSEKNLKVIRV